MHTDIPALSLPVVCLTLSSLLCQIKTLTADAPGTRHMLSCIGSLLGAQSKTDGGFWAQPRAQQLLAALLNFAVDERPKVRKAAQAAIGSLLREHRMAGSNAISKIVGQYCHTAIVNASQLKNDKASMQVLILRADGPMLHSLSQRPLSSCWPSFGHACLCCLHPLQTRCARAS